MVPPSRNISDGMENVTPAPGTPICNKIQQSASVCLTSSRPASLGSGLTQHALGGSGSLFFPSGGKTKRLLLQEDHLNCSRLVRTDPTVPAQPTKSAHSSLQSDSTQECDKPKSPCLAPLASVAKEQGFS